MGNMRTGTEIVNPCILSFKNYLLINPLIDSKSITLTIPLCMLLPSARGFFVLQIFLLLISYNLNDLIIL